MASPFSRGRTRPDPQDTTGRLWRAPGHAPAGRPVLVVLERVAMSPSGSSRHTGTRPRGSRVGRALASAALALVPLAAVPAAPQVAHADTAGALAACRRSESADFSIGDFRVYGNGGGGIPQGSNPPNLLQDGDVFLLLSSSYYKVKFDSWPWGPSYPPDGNGVPAPSTGWPYPGSLEYSAILRFNNDPGGWVGPIHQATAFGGCTVWSGPPVRLLFGVNDPNPGDNSGYWSFGFYLYRASTH
ncbi:hypothetical protein ABZ470_27090 [Streptosporangium sp. NPDC020072]|uniref:hypothetical protein n=2 Tax=unclassified Streptosporangium TaxID=2632669 RepID=UPI00343B1FD4